MSSGIDKRSLREQVGTWVDAGIISADQADAILRCDDTAVTDDRPLIITEVASYLGSVIAFAGGATIIAPRWDDLGLVGQTAVSFAIAITGISVGTWLFRLSEPGARRLGGFLLAIGTGGLALATGAIVDHTAPRNGAWYPLTIGMVVFVASLGLWRNRDRPLQLGTTAVGAFLIGVGIVDLTDLSIWVVSPALWLISFGIGVLFTLRLLRPEPFGLFLATLGLMIASFSLMEEAERVGATLAAATAAMIVIYALIRRSWPLVGVGLVEFFIAMMVMMSVVMQSTASRILAVVIGLLAVAGVAATAQRQHRAPRREHRRVWHRVE